MKTVCMIPARSGSKRIPGKNIKDFLGKPIITYPIEVAKESGIFDDIVVYTDSENIASITLTCDCNVADRISDDTETLTETIMKFIRPDRMDIDYLCVLLPTAVFVNTLELKQGYVFNSNKIDCAITFCKYSPPIQHAFKFDDHTMQLINKEYEFTRTQDCETTYHDAGQMYFLNVKSFLEQKKIFMNNIYPIIIDAVDIDNPEDWGKAEAYYKYQKGLI
jgi:pseudaminic acid cytidylyltransferase